MSLNGYRHSVAERLMRYVTVDTQSDPASAAQPSTAKQLDLSRMLVDELKAIGIADAELDEHGYVYATIESNRDRDVPVLCFCAHVDTAPDCSGTGVVPMLHQNYDGSDIVLPQDPQVILSASEHPYLKQRIGDDLITASGTTLLGADDKAGVAVIMDFAAYIMSHPDVPHGRIRLFFTPDEEIGRGVAKADMKRLAADYGYTLDGGERGHLEGATFSADAMTVQFRGISAHPGYAKGKMVNAIRVASDFMSRFPRDRWSPETTEGLDGFVHPTGISGSLEEATVSFIVRDFDTAKLAEYEEQVRRLAQQTIQDWPGAQVRFTVTEQYRNMEEILVQHPYVMDYAEEAYRRAGITADRIPVRGGTDGSRLSFMGLPCPNLFTGEMGIHSKQEYVSVQDMEKSVEVLTHLAQIWADQGRP